MTTPDRGRWKERAEAPISRMRTNSFDEEAQDAALAIVNERLDDSGLRGKVWGNMTYACERCGTSRLYEMEVGVEGPPDWREDLTFLASAFSAGHCEACRGVMMHTNWSGDETYAEPRGPSVADVFRVPREWPTYPTRGIYEDGTVITDRGRSAFLSLNLDAVPGLRT